MTVLRAVSRPDGATHPNAARWYGHMLGLSAYKLSNLPGAVTSLAPMACAPCAPGGGSMLDAAGGAVAGGFAMSTEPVRHPR